MTQDAEDSDLHPRKTSQVIGHEAVERLLLADFNREKLPGAYLFAGPKGIGKASMAYRFARFLLATPAPGQQEAGLFGDALPPILPTSLDIDPEHPAARRIAAGGHANVLTIERSYDEKKKQMRGEIVIEDVRRIGNFLSKSSGEEGWRIVIIDAADEMNNNAANAILKWLEEPPQQAIFLLVAHHPGKLLPTIRSRCRTLTFAPPSREAFDRVVSTQEALTPDDLEHLYYLSAGAPGWALQLRNGGMSEVMDELLELFEANASPLKVEQFAEQLTSNRKKERNFAELANLLLSVLAGIIRCSAGTRSLHAPEKEARVFAKLAQKKPLDYWLDLWEKCAPLLADVERVHLDARLVVSAMLSALLGRENMLHYMKGVS